jgi:hypothetical protein
MSVSDHLIRITIPRDGHYDQEAVKQHCLTFCEEVLPAMDVAIELRDTNGVTVPFVSVIGNEFTIPMPKGQIVSTLESMITDLIIYERERASNITSVSK